MNQTQSKTVTVNAMLKDLSSHLDSNGDIKNSSHVFPIISLMNQAEKVSHCCAFINIIKRTLLSQYKNNETTIIDIFLQNGGLDVLFKWLETAKTIPDYNFMHDLLDLYKELPLNMDILIVNSKTLNLISSISNSEQVPTNCKLMASETSLLWKRLTSSINHTESDSVQDSNKMSKNSNDHESIYIPTDSSSSSSSDENSNNNNLNEEEQQTIVKIKPQQSTTPSSSNYLNTTKLINFASGFKIPKRARPEGSNETIPEKKIKNEEDDRKDKTKDAKKQKQSPNPPLLTKQTEQQQSTATKPTPTKPKTNSRHESQDADPFMEALNSATSGTNRTLNRNQLKPNSSTNNASNNNNNNKLNIDHKKSKQINDSDSQNIINNKNNNCEDANMSIDGELSVTSNSLSGKSNLSEPGMKKIKKKKVVWADTYSKQLVNYCYFFLDENEKVIKKSAFKGDISKIEKLNEREFRNSMRNVNDEDEPWPTSLILIDIPNTVIIPEVKSEEKQIQADREKNTLAMLLFKPDSATEPDNYNMEELANLKTKIIPIDDINSTAEVNLLNEEIKNDIPAPSAATTTITTTTTTTKDFQPNPPNNILNFLTQIPTNNLLTSDQDTENIKKILKQLEYKTPTSTTTTTTTINSELLSLHSDDIITNFKNFPSNRNNFESSSSSNRGDTFQSKNSKNSINSNSNEISNNEM